jgi:hypothetical protein
MKEAPPSVPPIPDIPQDQMTPLIRVLLEILQTQALHISYLKDENQKLKDEISLLKKGNPRPKIQPSTLEKPPKSPDNSSKRPGSAKRSKTSNLKIHRTERIKPENMPPGSIFKDLHTFVVQDIRIENENTLYQLERWEGPNGEYLVGMLPKNVSGHFGHTLTSYILYQYYGALVTRPILLTQLHELGIDISRGQLDRVLIQGKESFHQEKADILSTGIRLSRYIQTDDTKARHAGKNGFCTLIAGELFSWFSSTECKNRINFLSLLQGERVGYEINDDARAYIRAHTGMDLISKALEEHSSKKFDTEEAWLEHLKALGITKPLEGRIATEGALFGHLIAIGIPKGLAVLSDDAGQFNVFDHFLCWIHEERHLKGITPYNEQNRQEIEDVLMHFWELYQELKEYRQSPSDAKRSVIEQRFETLFQRETTSNVFNAALRNIYNKKSELLKVLQRPEVPLHNNGSEQEIREYVKRRKISGGTRSSIGRACRDTFTSLKKTCYKLSIPFWDYLKDRVNGAGSIVYLPTVMYSNFFKSCQPNTV